MTEYDWVTIKKIFNYIGSPHMKILQEVLRVTFFTHTVHRGTIINE